MYDYEYTDSERGTFNHNKKSIKYDSIDTFVLNEGRKKEEERYRNRFEKTGDSRIDIEKGTEDRLNAIPYNNLGTTSRAIKGYNYGYYEKGTRTISAKIDILSQEELEAIGYNDSLDSLIDFDLLPEVVKTNSYYLKGYNKRGRTR